MCLKLSAPSIISTNLCYKGFNVGMHTTGKYKLLLPFYHDPKTPDLLLNQTYEADTNKHVMDMHGTTYTAGWHVYRQRHDWIDNTDYIKYLIEYNQVLMLVELWGIKTVGYQNDFPC